MKQKRKFLNVILVIALCITCVPNVVLASSGKLTLKAAASGENAIKLSWNKVKGTKMYAISVNQKGKKAAKIKVAGTKKSYTVKKLSGKKLVSDKTYVAKITAYKDKKCKKKLKASKSVSVALVSLSKVKADSIKKIEKYEMENSEYAALLTKNNVMSKIKQSVNSQKDKKAVESITNSALKKLADKKDAIMSAGEQDLKAAKEMALIEYFVKEGKYDVNKNNLEDSIDNIIQAETDKNTKTRYKKFVSAVNALTLEDDYINELSKMKETYKKLNSSLKKAPVKAALDDALASIDSLQVTLELSSAKNESIADVYDSVVSDEVLVEAEKVVTEIKTANTPALAYNKVENWEQTLAEMLKKLNEQAYEKNISTHRDKLLKVAGVENVEAIANIENTELKNTVEKAVNSFYVLTQAQTIKHITESNGYAPYLDEIVDAGIVNISKVQLEQNIKTIDEVKSNLKALLIGYLVSDEYQNQFITDYGLSELVNTYMTKLDENSTKIVDAFAEGRKAIKVKVYEKVAEKEILEKANVVSIDKAPANIKKLYEDVCVAYELASGNDYGDIYYGFTTKLDKAMVLAKAEMIGGTIFDVNTDLATTGGYKFYTKSGVEIKGDLTADNLDDAYYYTVTNKDASNDAIYAYATIDKSHNVVKKSDMLSWSDDLAEISTKGNGKANTTTLIAKYGQKAGTVWNWINSLNTSKHNDCADWYIGSKDEMDKWIKYNPDFIGANDLNVWTSTENSKDKAYALSRNKTTGETSLIDYDKTNTRAVAVAIRSF